ncbi:MULTISPECIES: hypothetical protein [unclassified Clostridium]|uniref:hypothetical protein n=1 Tax=unclassified Clostridium TaxID=2614128 RepID=UPI0013FC67C5|nr:MULTISPECIES: hypothetical protein [unclassified Clostridium]NFR85396.1 hypothetical protein [Clostridium botulinum]NFR90931.1 hypothetical protein [Clostridium botulinum]NFT98794.1 hypothetical protein [Clostridium botulinum]
MRIDFEGLLEGLGAFNTRTTAAMKVYSDTAGKKLESEAQKGAQLVDRTGLSRKTIEGGSQMNGDECVVYVAGNTEQFPYLELAHDKKYATLQPAVDKLTPEILRGLSNLLGR